ncbi:hypothetical protein HAX54_003823 [Datura stramonium]|uniref:Acetyl-CoA carboxylase n=1 Tax=Datura stramonium TaxID=4076 RepID=A0ABS8T6N4_DATST|nr:hypothetical protein [Datura stramonium]
MILSPLLINCGSQAIHPGYGFLSESAILLNFFLGFHLCSGYHGGDEQDIDFMKLEADKIGYPILIKPTHGGGGKQRFHHKKKSYNANRIAKGMRIVQSPDEFADSFLSAQREAAASFGISSTLLEKYITKPRHIEVQRRHQKIIEEAPAPNVSADFRSHLGQAAVSAKAVNYHSAGTVSSLYRRCLFQVMLLSLLIYAEMFQKDFFQQLVFFIVIVLLQLASELELRLELRKDTVKYSTHKKKFIMKDTLRKKLIVLCQTCRIHCSCMHLPKELATLQDELWVHHFAKRTVDLEWENQYSNSGSNLLTVSITYLPDGKYLVEVFLKVVNCAVPLKEAAMSSHSFSLRRVGMMQVSPLIHFGLKMLATSLAQFVLVHAKLDAPSSGMQWLPQKELDRNFVSKTSIFAGSN